MVVCARTDYGAGWSEVSKRNAESEATVPV
jgi:hypothetical protein